jgi:hypothetical protein
MYLSEEERHLLAQQQQSLLQKHFKCLSQQREAQEQGPDQPGVVVSAKQVEPAALQRQAQAMYQQQQGVSSDYGSGQAPSNTAAGGPSQPQATWGATGIQTASRGHQTPPAAAYTGAIAPGGTFASQGTPVAAYAQARNEQGSFAVGAQLPVVNQDVGAGTGGDEDDLFRCVQPGVALVAAVVPPTLHYCAYTWMSTGLAYGGSPGPLRIGCFRSSAPRAPACSY